MQRREHIPTEGQSRQDAALAAMIAYLKPYAEGAESLWDYMEVAFESSFGRPVNKFDAHDIMLCQVALSRIPQKSCASRTHGLLIGHQND